MAGLQNIILYSKASYLENQTSSFQQRLGELDSQLILVFPGMQHPSPLGALKILA